MSRYSFERRRRRQRQADRIEDAGLGIAAIVAGLGLLSIPAAALGLVPVDVAGLVGAFGFVASPIAALGSLALATVWSERA